MPDDTKTTVTFPTGEIVDFDDGGRMGEAIAEILRKGMGRNQILLEVFRQSIIQLRMAEHATSKAYQQMVGQWEGENTPFGSVKESILFHTAIKKVDTGMDTLQEILNEIQQLKMF